MDPPSKTSDRMSEIYSNASFSYQWWWKFNNFYDEKYPRRNKKTTRKFLTKKQSIKLRKKNLHKNLFFFLWKHVFSNSIFRCYFFKRIFNEKVIWSIYFKLVRLFTQIVSSKIYSKEFSLPNLNTLGDNNQLLTVFFFVCLSAWKDGEREKNLENVNAETK